MTEQTIPIDRITLPNTLLREGIPDVEDLMPSVRDLGILQPLLIRREGMDYLLVAGKRRYTAAKQAGLSEVPCIIREDLDNRRARIAELTENLARRDMTPHQEARGLVELIGFEFESQGMEVPPAEVQRMLYRLSNEIRGKVKQSTLRDGVEGDVILRVFDLVGRSFTAFVTGVLPALSWPKDVQEAMDAGMSRAAARQIAAIKDDTLRSEALERVKSGERPSDVREELLSGASESRMLNKDMSAGERLEMAQRDSEGWLKAQVALDKPEATGLSILPRNGLIEELIASQHAKRIVLHNLPAEDSLTALNLGVDVWSSASDERFAGEHNSLNFEADLIIIGGKNALDILGDAKQWIDEQQGEHTPRFTLIIPHDAHYIYKALNNLAEPPQNLLVAVEPRGDSRVSEFVLVGV